MREGMKKKTPNNEAYKREDRKRTNKIKRMRRTLKRQPNNKELKLRLKKLA